jgi:hypothetical protein
MEKPAYFRIRVRGEVSPTWSDRLQGMTITQEDAGGGETVTTLQGALRDQAALAGVLNTLYEFHFPVLFVETLERTGH